MKLIKNLTLAAATLTLAACSTEVSPEKAAINSASGVTVEMGEAELQFPEAQESNSTFYQIPIVVEGQTNGAVEVTVEFGEIETSPAKYGENYIVTSKKVIIPEGSNSGYVEFYPKDDDDIVNDDRQFTATIVSASGASVGTQKTTLVSLLDDEPMKIAVYNALQGSWLTSANSVFDGPITYQMIIQGFPEDDARYLKYVNLVGIGGDPDFVVPAKMACNPVTGRTTLSVAVFEDVIGQVVAGSAGLVDIRLLYISGESILTTGTITASVNSDVNTIRFNGVLYGGAFKAGSESTSDYLGGWFYDEDVVMTKM